MNKTVPLLAIIVVCLAVLFFIRGNNPGKDQTSAPPAKEVLAQWKVHEDPNHQYEVSFPTPPRAVSNNALDPKTKQLKIYKLQVSEALDATLFMVTQIQFPPDFDPAKDPTILDDTVKELVANAPTNTLKDLEQTTFNGDEAVKFTIESADKIVIHGVAFVRNKIIYILSRVSKEDKENIGEFDHFVKSFKFKEKSEGEAIPLNPKNKKGSI